MSKANNGNYWQRILKKDGHPCNNYNDGYCELDPTFTCTFCLPANCKDFKRKEDGI